MTLSARSAAGRRGTRPPASPATETPPGPGTSTLLPDCRIRDCSCPLNGCDELSADNNATSMSFRTHRDWRIARAAVAGRPTGDTSRVRPAPRSPVPPRGLRHLLRHPGEAVPQQGHRERQPVTAGTALAAVLLAMAPGLPLAHWLIDARGRSSGIGAGIAQPPSPALLVLLGAAAVPEPRSSRPPGGTHGPAVSRTR